MADKTVDLLKLMRKSPQGQGLRIVSAVTSDPHPLTFVFEGTKRAIDAELFEIPVDMYPIKEGERFTAFPILTTGQDSRWALLSKLNGCKVCLATMQGSTGFIIDGISKTYTGDSVILQSGLINGDRVAVVPVLDGGIVKYAVINKMA